MIWLALYAAALMLTAIVCWERGWGYRRASLLLCLNLVVQVSIEALTGDFTPTGSLIVLDMLTGFAIALCPDATCAHSIVATCLLFQVSIHFAYLAAGEPGGQGQFYYYLLRSIGGWAQAAVLLGGAINGSARRYWVAGPAGRRLARVVGGDHQGVAP
ncbi:hypothetical protein [Sandarakinorhabdus sp.]|uniref:hypothetical protein n=1 Tax=Sandarakinorhabdus sp. TaxID=1916663 RepID=UPI00286E39DC|nr:hypothetical protein [Sandarakinorhabdus sp.]